MSNIVPASTTLAFKEEGLTSCPQALDSGSSSPMNNHMQQEYLSMSIKQRSVIHPPFEKSGLLTEGDNMEKDEIKRNWITDQIGLDENNPDEARIARIMRSLIMRSFLEEK